MGSAHMAERRHYKNPVALPQNNIQYVLTAISTNGCIGTDTIDIKLYKIDPDMLVPSAF